MPALGWITVLRGILQICNERTQKAYTNYLRITQIFPLGGKRYAVQFKAASFNPTYTCSLNLKHEHVGTYHLVWSIVNKLLQS